jgi:hypothetical protein
VHCCSWLAGSSAAFVPQASSKQASTSADAPSPKSINQSKRRSRDAVWDSAQPHWNKTPAFGIWLDWLAVKPRRDRNAPSPAGWDRACSSSSSWAKTSQQPFHSHTHKTGKDAARERPLLYNQPTNQPTDSTPAIMPSRASAAPCTLPAPAPGDSRRRRPRAASQELQQLEREEEEHVMVPTGRRSGSNSGAASKPPPQQQLGEEEEEEEEEPQALPMPLPLLLPAAVVVVDPISSGAVLALLAQQRGFQVLAVYRCVCLRWRGRVLVTVVVWVAPEGAGGASPHGVSCISFGTTDCSPPFLRT